MKRPATLKGALKRELEKPSFQEAFDREDIPARLALQIAKLREEKGWTQRELAEKLHVSQQAISQLEDTSSASFTISTLQRIAGAFKKQLVIKLR